MVYLPTFEWSLYGSIVGQYTSPMEPIGWPRITDWAKETNVAQVVGRYEDEMVATSYAKKTLFCWCVAVRCWSLICLQHMVFLPLLATMFCRGNIQQCCGQTCGKSINYQQCGDIEINTWEFTYHQQNIQNWTVRLNNISNGRQFVTLGRCLLLWGFHIKSSICVAVKKSIGGICDTPACQAKGLVCCPYLRKTIPLLLEKPTLNLIFNPRTFFQVKIIHRWNMYKLVAFFSRTTLQLTPIIFEKSSANCRWKDVWAGKIFEVQGSCVFFFFFFGIKILGLHASFKLYKLGSQFGHFLCFPVLCCSSCFPWAPLPLLLNLPWTLSPFIKYASQGMVFDNFGISVLLITYLGLGLCGRAAFLDLIFVDFLAVWGPSKGEHAVAAQSLLQ